MTTPWDGFGAHQSHALSPRPLDQGVEVLQKRFCLHVVGVAAKRWIAPRRIGRIGACAAQAAEAMRIPLTVIRDTFTDKRTAYEAKLILVRPDHFVAWCANEAPADASAILRKAVGGA